MWLLGERAARATVTAGVLAAVARHLQPAGFGQLNFVATVAAIASAFATLGLEGLVVNELVRRPDAPGAVLGTAFRLRLAAGGLTALALALVALIVPAWRSDAPLLAVMLLGLVFQPAEVIDLFFQRHLDSRRTVIVRTVAVAAGAGLKLTLVAVGAGVPAFVWAQIAETFLFAAGLGFAYWRAPARPDSWRWDPAIAREFLRRGTPLAISGAAVALSLRMDQLLVRAYLDPRQLGVYYSAARLTEIALLVGTAMTLSFFPALAESHLQHPREFRLRLQAMFDVLSGLGWCVALAFTFLGPALLHLLYGTSYAGAATALALHGWACVFALSAGARWQYILVAAPTSVNFAAALLSIGTQLALGSWLVPAFGVRGAAATWLAAAVVSGFLSTFAFPVLRGCARAQARGLLIPFAPRRWRPALALFSS